MLISLLSLLLLIVIIIITIIVKQNDIIYKNNIDTLCDENDNSLINVEYPKAAIIYVYYNRPNEQKNETNLAFFIRQTVLKDNKNIYLFILNNYYTEVVIPKQENVYILKNKNCYDIESYGIGIKYLEKLKLHFERLVLINCGVTGPFYNGKNWLEPFEKQIKNTSSHICSTISYKINNLLYNPGYFNYFIYNKKIKTILLKVLKFYKLKSDIIDKGEFGISNNLNNKNFKITSLIDSNIYGYRADRDTNLDSINLYDIIFIKNVWKEAFSNGRDSLPIKYEDTIFELNKISNFDKNIFNIDSIDYNNIKIPKKTNSCKSIKEYYDIYGISEEYIIYPKIAKKYDKLALYCHSDNENLFRSFCIDAVNTLALLDYKVIILTTCNYFKNINNLPYEIITVNESKIDTYMIKTYLNNYKIEQYTHLLTVNDSLIFPIHGINNMKKTIDKFSNIDFWGIWSSPENKEHIMSSFLHFSKITFNTLVKNLNNYNLKSFENAQLWEINLLEEMKNNNFTTESVIDYKSLGDLNKLTCPIMHPTIFPKWIKNEEVFAIKWKYISNYLNKEKLNMPYMNYLLRYLHFNHTGIKGKPEMQKAFDNPLFYLK